MAYLQHTSWRDRPGAVAAVIAIHGLIGYGLVAGMNIEAIIKHVPNLEGGTVVEPMPLPPPPPPRDEKVEADPKLIDRPVVVPLQPLDLSTDNPVIDNTPIIVPNTDLLPKVIPSPTPGASAQPKAAFNPIAARPRNDPGGWVTTDDYKSNWINREMVGTARFRLEVAPSGKVESCAITRTSGHPELDRATCDLVTKRARFDPAKDDSGAKVSGTYTSSVQWTLPD